MRRVVITGMAPVCAAGCSHEEMFQNLCDKKQTIAKIEKNTQARQMLESSYYVPYPSFDTTKYEKEMRNVKKKGAGGANAAVFAALNALEDANLKTPDEDTIVLVGVGAPSMPEISKLILDLNEQNKIEVLGILKAMQSSIAAWISIVLGTHGKSATVSLACASGTETVGMGYESIKNGKCNMAICGGSDYLSDRNMVVMRGFEKLSAVSSDPEGLSYPFSKEHSGFLFSEGGAAMIVLEELEHARKRNAPIYAEITGFENASDAFSIVSMPKDGAVVKKMLRKLVGNKKVDYYNAHGTGTPLNDEMEAGVIREVFGEKEKQPAISATKSIIGHTLGASGTIEIMVCAESIRHNKVHGNICKTIEEDLNITSETRDWHVDRAVSASFGFGGHNAAIMIERFEE